MLRLNLFNTNMQSMAQWLATRTNPLNQTIINRFQSTLEAHLYKELSRLDHSEEHYTEMDFERWVGCLEYGPNTYLADVAESLSISPLYFPPQTGWYINPGQVISLNGEVRKVNENQN